MKKTIAILLLAVMMLVPALSMAKDITFVIRVHSAGFLRERSITLDTEMHTLGDLKSYIRSMGADWKAPGKNKAKIGDYYTTSPVTLDVSGAPSTYVSPDGTFFAPSPFGGAYKQAEQAPAKQKGSSSTASNPNRTTYKNIVASTQYLYQVNVNNRSLDFRLFGDGQKIAFLEKFGTNDEGKIRMTLTVWQAYDELKPVYTEDAIKALKNLDVAEVVISSKNNEDKHTMDELLTMLGTD